MTIYGIYDVKEIWINDQFKGYSCSIVDEKKPQGRLYFKQMERNPIPLKADPNKALEQVKSNNGIAS